MAYMLLRLVDDFSDVPAWLMRGALIALVLLAAGAFVFAQPLPALAHCADADLSDRAATVQRNRLRARVAPVERCHSPPDAGRCGRVDPAGAGVCVGDATADAARAWIASGRGCRIWPGWRPRAATFWALPRRAGYAGPGRNPSCARSLGGQRACHACSTSRRSSPSLRAARATSLGAPNARIGLWDAEARKIYFPLGDPNYALDPNEPIPAARAFRTQQPAFSANIPLEHPEYAEISRKWRLTAVLAAPISAGEKRLGVLVVYAPRAPIFADDDLALLQLLADQAAVILESRTLLDEATRVRAREEATRLREDFLSAAAHDLKTPLTTLIGKAQLMERLALRNPSAPADLAGLQLLVREGQRLRQIVLELLDAARAEQGRLVGERAPVDLVALAEEVCARHSCGSPSLRCREQWAGDR